MAEGTLNSGEKFINSLPNHFKRIPDDVEAYVYQMGNDVADDNIAKLFVRTENQGAFRKANKEEGSLNDLTVAGGDAARDTDILKVKDDQVDVGTSIGDNNSPVSVDNFSVGQGSFFYDHFIINNIAYQSSQKVQIVQTFSDDFLYSFGENPVQATFSGILLNTDNHRWRDHWLYTYDELLNAHDSIKHNVDVYIMFEEIVWRGRILDTSFSEKARRSRGLNFNFTFYIQDKIKLKEKPPHETHNASVKKSDSGEEVPLKNRISDFKNVDIKQTQLDILDTAVRDEAKTPEDVEKNAGEEDEDSDLQKAVREANSDTEASADRIIEEIKTREENDNTDGIKGEMADVINKEDSTGAELKKNIKNALESSKKGEYSKLTAFVSNAIQSIKEIADEDDSSIHSVPNNEEAIEITSTKPDGTFNDFLPDNKKMGYGTGGYKTVLTDLGQSLRDKNIGGPNMAKTDLAGIYGAKANGWLKDFKPVDKTSVNFTGSYVDNIVNNSLPSGASSSSGRPGMRVELTDSSSLNENKFLNEFKSKIQEKLPADKSPYDDRNFDSAVEDGYLKIRSNNIHNSVYPSSVTLKESEKDKVNQKGEYGSTGIKIENLADNVDNIGVKVKPNFPNWPHLLTISPLTFSNSVDTEPDKDIEITVKFYPMYNGGGFTGNNITSKVKKIRNQVKAVTHEKLNSGDLENDYQLSISELNNWFNGRDS